MVSVMSSEQKFISKVNLILRTIEKERTINRFVLCRQTNMTPRQYSSLHGYLQEGYADKITFDDKTKIWSWIGKAPEPPKTLEEALKDGNTNE